MQRGIEVFVEIILCTSLVIGVAPFTQAQFVFSEEFQKVDSLPGLPSVIEFETINVPISSTGLIYNLYEDSKGYIWLRLGWSGCLRYDGFELQQFGNHADGGIANLDPAIHDIAEDADGSHWISSKEGMIYYDDHLKLKRSCARSFVQSQKDPYLRSFFNIEKTHDDHLLICTKAGLLIYDIEKDSIEDKLYCTEHIVDRESTSNHFRNIQPDRQDSSIFWITTRSGLQRFDYPNRSFEWIENPVHDLDQMRYWGYRYFEPIGQELFTLVENNYLMSFHTVSRKWRILGEWHGKPDPGYIFYDIKPVMDRYLFLSTQKDGLYFIDAKEEKYTNVTYLLDGEDKRGNQVWCFLVDRQGHIWSAVTPGVLLRSKHPIHPATGKPPLDFQKIMVNNLELDYSRLQDQTLHLEKYERSFSLKYTFVNPPGNDSTQHYHRLKGHTRDWTPAVEKTANFNNLRPGKYTFEATLVNGYSEIQSQALSIHIPPYWYEMRGVQILLGCAGLTILFLINRANVRRVKEKTEMKAQFERELLELESKALRNQMNPHFLFNTLNSIKNYAIHRDREDTSEYISKFSILIRKILENSREDLVKLSNELLLLRSYIEIEQLRVKGGFDYSIDIDPNVDPDFYHVPPMLIQPFVENAIWHGLIPKESNKHLTIRVQQENEKLMIDIIDNGIGRKASGERQITTRTREGLGMKISQERIEHQNQLFQMQNSVEITDLYDSENRATGTKVRITIESQ